MRASLPAPLNWSLCLYLTPLLFALSRRLILAWIGIIRRSLYPRARDFSCFGASQSKPVSGIRQFHIFLPSFTVRFDHNWHNNNIPQVCHVTLCKIICKWCRVSQRVWIFWGRGCEDDGKCDDDRWSRTGDSLRAVSLFTKWNAHSRIHPVPSPSLRFIVSLGFYKANHVGISQRHSDLTCG